MCLAYVVKWLAAPKIGCPDAITSWNWSSMKRTDRNPPAGAPVYWQGGKHGHIALSVGGGTIRSTDCQSTYKVAEQPLSWVEQHWGYKYLGWCADISKAPIPYLQSAPAPKPPEDDMTKPTDVVGTDSDKTDLTMAELSGRMNWLYAQWLSAGSLKAQLDRIEAALKK